jgi:hypothetical protein
MKQDLIDDSDEGIKDGSIVSAVGMNVSVVQ